MSTTRSKTSPPPSPPKNKKRCRSVNDFDTDDALRHALLSTSTAEQQQQPRGGGEPDPSATTSTVMPSTTPCGDGMITTMMMMDDENNNNSDAGVSDESSEPHCLNTNLDWVLPDAVDPMTTEAQSMKEEIERLQVLKSYLILDADREESFERITAIAARVFAVPIALVSLIDLGRQWFMSNRGLGNVRETPRKLAFCAHGIQSKTDSLIVRDATHDFRFKDNPLVTGPPDIRFYAGVVLLSPEGYKLGTLCIIDRKPWPAGLTDDQLHTLRDLAYMTVQTLVSRRQKLLQQAESPAHLIAYTAHDLMQPLTGVQLSLSLLKSDDAFVQAIDAQQLELLNTATTCCHLMVRICETAITKLRRNFTYGYSSLPLDTASTNPDSLSDKDEQPHKTVTNLSDLLQNLHLILEPNPKHVPLILCLHPTCPESIVCDDLILFRSALNLLTSAASRTSTGSIVFSIAPSTAPNGKEYLVFECTDTAPNIPQYAHEHLFQQSSSNHNNNNADHHGGLQLSLNSLASLISSISGTYGFRPLGEGRNGSTFWFSVPLTANHSDCVDMNRESPVIQDNPRNQPPPPPPPPPEPLHTKKNPMDIDPSFLSPTQSSRAATADLSVMSLSPSSALEPQLRRCNSVTCISTTSGIPLLVQTETQADAVKSSCLGPLFQTQIKGRVRSEGNIAAATASLSSSYSLSVPTTTPFPSSSKSPSDNTSMSPSDTIHVGPATATLERSSHFSTTTTAAAADDSAFSSSSTLPPTRSRRALVIDDSLVVRKSLAMALKRLGFDVAQAENGQVGLQKLTEALYDLVLCDFLMPIMDGFDCVQQFRIWEVQNRSHMNCRQLIVGISAHADKAIAVQGMNAGMDSFLPKPIGVKALSELSEGPLVQKSSATLDAIEGGVSSSVQLSYSSSFIGTSAAIHDRHPPFPKSNTRFASPEPTTTRVVNSPLSKLSSPPTRSQTSKRPRMCPPSSIAPAQFLVNSNSNNNINNNNNNDFVSSTTALPTTPRIQMHNNPASSISMFTPLNNAFTTKRFTCLMAMATTEVDPSLTQTTTATPPPPSMMMHFDDDLLLPTMKARGWDVVQIHDGHHALRLLQTRNWDAVLIDCHLSGGIGMSGKTCMDQFQKWEHDNRVHCQKNTFFVSDLNMMPSCSSSVSSSSSWMIVQPPSGFQFVLQKPVLWKDIQQLLDQDSSMGIVIKGSHTQK